MVRTDHTSLQWLNRSCSPEKVARCLKNWNTKILQLQLLCFAPYFHDSGAGLIGKVINDF